jgi:hypothetical protein
VASRLRLLHSRALNRFFSKRRSFFSLKGSPSFPTLFNGRLAAIFTLSSPESLRSMGGKGILQSVLEVRQLGCFADGIWGSGSADEPAAIAAAVAAAALLMEAAAIGGTAALMDQIINNQVYRKRSGCSVNCQRGEDVYNIFQSFVSREMRRTTLVYSLLNARRT